MAERLTRILDALGDFNHHDVIAFELVASSAIVPMRTATGQDFVALLQRLSSIRDANFDAFLLRADEDENRK